MYVVQSTAQIRIIPSVESIIYSKVDGSAEPSRESKVGWWCYCYLCIIYSYDVVPLLSCFYPQKESKVKTTLFKNLQQKHLFSICFLSNERFRKRRKRCLLMSWIKNGVYLPFFGSRSLLWHGDNLSNDNHALKFGKNYKVYHAIRLFWYALIAYNKI